MQFVFVIGTPGAALQRRLVESSDPDDLARRVNLALDELNAFLQPPVFLASVNLAGAGDGDKWVVELVAAPAVNLQSLDGTTPPAAATQARLDPGNIRAICYKAADARELAIQRDRALSPVTPVFVTLEEMAGASQGLQHMGMVLLNF